MDFSRQPLQGSNVSAFVFALPALLFVVLWRRDRERGMRWLAVAYSVLAVQCALNDCKMVYYLASPLSPKRWQLALAVILAPVPTPHRQAAKRRCGLESFNRNISHDLRGSLGGTAGLARAAQDTLRLDGGNVDVSRRVCH